MDTAKKTVKKLRGQYRPPNLDLAKPWEIALAEAQARNGKVKMWENDKRIKRDQAFQKALLRLKEWREERRLEKERQEEITLQRLKNLKKARRTLARMREDS